jgi:hypothetical protein
MWVAGAARATGARASLRAGARLAGSVGGGDAQEFGQMLSAAGLARGSLAAANEQFLLRVAVAADEFVEGHRVKVTRDW